MAAAPLGPRVFGERFLSCLHLAHTRFGALWPLPCITSDFCSVSETQIHNINPELPPEKRALRKHGILASFTPLTQCFLHNGWG